MRLFINGRFLTQPVSGVQRYARELTNALDDLLADSAGLRAVLGPVEVLVPHEITLNRPDWRILGLRIIPGGRGHLWEQTTLYRASRRGVLLGLGNSGPLCHRAHVLTIHDAHIYQIPDAFSTTYRTVHKALRPRLARRAAALISVSRYSANRLGAFLGVSPDRFQIVHNAADHILRAPVDPGTPARYGLVPGGYLMALGTQSPNKNLGALIKAHGAAPPNLPDLALVGGGVPGLTHLEPDVAARVHVLGRVPDADLRGLYEGASGFVFPSLYEGFGIPPLEAMQLGVPVLSASTAALPEVLGEAPLWFDPRDPSSITGALARFSAMSWTERGRRVELGRTRAGMYSWHKSAGDLVRVLLGVLHPETSADFDDPATRLGECARRHPLSLHR